MRKSSPVEIYRQLAFKMRNRIEFAESIFGAQASSSNIAETVCLQGRKIIEGIAYMALVATDHSLGNLKIPRDAKTHWNAETIFVRLKKKKLTLLPSPSRMSKSDDLRYKFVFSGVPEYVLNYDDLIEMYRRFHKGLHEPNPYVQPDEDDFYKKLIPVLRQDIERLRNCTWIHFIGIKGQAFAVDLKNTHGVTAVVPLSKIAEPPSD